MTQPAHGLDPIVNSDRITGSTPPETGPQSSNVVGRPAIEKPLTAFHEPAEKPDSESEPLTEKETLLEGGSFDSLAPLQEIKPQ